MNDFALAHYSPRCDSQIIDSRSKPGVNRWTGTLLLLFTLALSACGGSSTSPAVSTGVFIDSLVEGLHYQTTSQSGSTNALGEFQYLPGETITFSIGGIVLGSVLVDPVITPLSLVPGAADESDPTVINIVRLLLSLDDDADLSNGITISATVSTAASGLSVDFGVSVDDLEFDQGVIALLSQLSDPTLVDAAFALSHFSQTLAALEDNSTWGSLQWGTNRWRSASQ